MPSGLVAEAFSADGSENVPLTRWPVNVELGSATLSGESPAVEMTLAVVDDVYVFASAGVNEAERGRRAERQAQRRRHGAAGVVVASTP